VIWLAALKVRLIVPALAPVVFSDVRFPFRSYEYVQALLVVPLVWVADVSRPVV